MRFGIAPLYLDADDVVRAASILEDIMVRRAWDDPRYRRRQTVT
jgi:kynureninase